MITVPIDQKWIVSVAGNHTAYTKEFSDLESAEAYYKVVESPIPCTFVYLAELKNMKRISKSGTDINFYLQEVKKPN